MEAGRAFLNDANSPRTKREAIVRISPELLFQWLQFKGAMLVDARVNNWASAGVLELVIAHPEMPKVREGEVIPVVTPTYRTRYSKRGKVLGVTRDKVSHV
jgi:hypothetical protein